MQYTLVNDLNIPMDEIAIGIKKNCKCEIRRAEKIGRFKTYSNVHNTFRLCKVRSSNIPLTLASVPAQACMSVQRMRYSVWIAIGLVWLCIRIPV